MNGELSLIEPDIASMRNSATPAQLDAAWKAAQDYIFSLRRDEASENRLLVAVNQERYDIIQRNRWGVQESPISPYPPYANHDPSGIVISGLPSWLPWAVAGGAALLLILSMRKRANP